MPRTPSASPSGVQYHSAVLLGTADNVLDRNLDTSVHLDHAHGESWVTFDLRVSFTISAFKLQTSWTNGPRKTKLEYSESGHGPWNFAGDLIISGENHIDPLHDGHTRQYDRKATVLQNFGRLTARYQNPPAPSRHSSLATARLVPPSWRDSLLSGNLTGPSVCVPCPPWCV